jgi:RNA-directed DNA polymerase
VISPLLANLFLHYAFDVWMEKQFPEAPFERYCDDGVVHCETEKQALSVRDAIARRLANCGLELHPDKTRIVYCKDANRRATYANKRFNFLGYTFRARSAVGNAGKAFASFQPAVSRDALAEMSQKLRSWRINRRTNMTLNDLAQLVNIVVQGWINYYGRFYQTGLYPLLSRIDNYVVRRATRKYKRLHGSHRRARNWLVRVAKRAPGSSLIGQIPARFTGQVVSDLHAREEGVRIKHRLNANSVKLYDKAFTIVGNVLRAEGTINDVSDFRAFMPKEGDPNGALAWRPLRRGIADLHRRAEVGRRATERYLDALASVDTDTTLDEVLRGQAASSSFEVQLAVDSRTSATVTTKGLPKAANGAASFETAQFKGVQIGKGKHTLTAMIDPSGRVPQADTEYNSLSVPVQCGE